MRKSRAIVWVFAAPIVVALSGRQAAAGADEGKALYDQKCKICHSIAGEAGKMADKGGPLDGVGSKRDAAWLKKYMADPKSAMPDAKMPKMKLGEKQLDDLIAYMLTLK
jgi:nitric oxide reductase subunit C